MNHLPFREVLEKQSVADCHYVKCYRCPKLAINCLFVIISLCSRKERPDSQLYIIRSYFIPVFPA